MDNLYDYLQKEYNASFYGWDFSYLNGRMEQDELPWSYKSIVEKYFCGKDNLLDMDTGGGEFLCSLSNLPKNVFATEGYEPNVPIAEKKLKERNIQLRAIKTDGEIPFDDKYFDIIINRQGSYKINEIKKSLRKNGLFITQQVGSLNGIDINMAFGTETTDCIDWCLVKNIEMFNNSGMEIIECGENIGKMRFNDTGAIVYYLKCIPWQVKDFSIDKYHKKLEIMDSLIKKDGYINFILHRFYLVAKKVS